MTILLELWRAWRRGLVKLSLPGLERRQRRAFMSGDDHAYALARARVEYALDFLVGEEFALQDVSDQALGL